MPCPHASTVNTTTKGIMPLHFLPHGASLAFCSLRVTARGLGMAYMIPCVLVLLQPLLNTLASWLSCCSASLASLWPVGVPGLFPSLCANARAFPFIWHTSPPLCTVCCLAFPSRIATRFPPHPFSLLLYFSPWQL